MKKIAAVAVLFFAMVFMYSCSDDTKPNTPGGNAVKQWSLLGVPGFSTGRAYFPRVEARDGVVYAAYADQGNAYKPYVKAFNGSAWVDVGTNPVDDSEGKTELDFAVNKTTGQLLLAGNGVGYPYFHVYSYDGSPWAELGGGALSSDEYYGHVEAEGNTVYITRGMSSVIAQKFIMPSGPWEYVGGENVTPSAADWGNLDLYGGEIYAAFPESNQKTTVLKVNGSAWEPIGGVQFSAGASMLHTIKADSTGVYVLYLDLADGQKATLMKYDGVSWSALGGQGFSVNSVYGPALALEDGVPYVSYIKQSDFALVVQKYTDLGWENMIPDSLGCSGTSKTDICVENGNVYVAFDDMNNNYKISVAAYR